MNISKQEGYRTAFKATAIFGGVQVITILISILKSKMVATWLGTSGLGIMSLFAAATGLIFSITNLGLQSSAVRDIADAQGRDDIKLVSKIVKAIYRWVYVTGFAGALITIILSPWLSKWLFKNSEYTLSFIFLSAVVFLTGIYNAHYATLQGTRNLKLLAKANVFGGLAGFTCSIPIFYFFRESGIIAAMILTALSTAGVSILFARRVKLVDVKQTYKESYYLGLNTAKLGIAMAVSAITVLLVEFIVKAYIARLGGINDVGLYQAGWALNASYLGMVFGAMGKDYFPRLSQNAEDNILINERVNQQSEIAILILAPLVLGMIVFMPLIIRILYSTEFLGIVEMATWLMIGSLVKAGSWGISFVFLAKSDVKLFLFNELGINCIILPAYLFGYYLFGLAGIGYAFTFNYLVYFLWVGIVAYKKYRIKYSINFWKTFLLLILTVLIFPFAKLFWNASSITGIVLLTIIGCFSLYELNKKLNLIELLRRNQKK
jgi:O-antigen/teichoic acid export membrane protein